MAIAVKLDETHATHEEVKLDEARTTHEEVASIRGARSGVPMAVAVHSTALGPALGGLRIWSYPDPRDAERDVLRLAEGMTLKAAAAGLDLGGGKGVICAPAEGLDGELRHAALLDFGDLVESLGGSYITAEDVGVTPADIAVVAQRTTHVTGLPSEGGGSGDPSPVTAVGVESAILACARHRWGSDDLRGRRVAILGMGHVGGRLARRLHDRGCQLIAADVDPCKRPPAEALGARWVDAAIAMRADCDVLAPCALGGAITAESVPRLGCEVVCGAANNQLAGPGLAASLAERGILYAPDFIANAGGLMSVYGELHGHDADRAVELARGIEATMLAVLEEAVRRGTTPLAAAGELAERRLASALPN
jgi:leucine dehydrogenase